jgi:hypothetical protein
MKESMGVWEYGSMGVKLKKMHYALSIKRLALALGFRLIRIKFTP